MAEIGNPHFCEKLRYVRIGDDGVAAAGFFMPIWVAKSGGSF